MGDSATILESSESLHSWYFTTEKEPRDKAYWIECPQPILISMPDGALSTGLALVLVSTAYEIRTQIHHQIVTSVELGNFNFRIAGWIVFLLPPL